MRYIRQITFAILSSVILISAAIAQPAANVQTAESSDRRLIGSYLVRLPSESISELRCRGGRGFLFQAVGSRTHSSGAAITILELPFSPGLQGAGSLQPGECAFVQRGFYLDEVGQVREPLKVRFETPANAQLKQTQSGSAVDRSSTRAETLPDAISIPEYLNNPDRYWSFRVVNFGKGYFEAVGHGHWKSPVQESSLKRSGGAIFRKY